MIASAAPPIGRVADCRWRRGGPAAARSFAANGLRWRALFTIVVPITGQAWIACWEVLFWKSIVVSFFVWFNGFFYFRFKYIAELVRIGAVLIDQYFPLVYCILYLTVRYRQYLTHVIHSVGYPKNRIFLQKHWNIPSIYSTIRYAVNICYIVLIWGESCEIDKLIITEI